MPWFFYAILSAVSYSFFTIFSKLGTKDTDPTLAATIYFVISSTFLVALCFYLNKFSNNQNSTWESASIPFILLASVANGLSWVFYLIALRDVSAAKVSSVDLMSYFFTAMLGVLLLGEVFQFKYIIGALLITLGACLF
jgi:bacterial/archaeal transporter family protein